MNKHFKNGWRSKVSIVHMGKADEKDLGWRVETSFKGVVYVLQADWKWSSCPIGRCFVSEHQAAVSLANVDPPWIQLGEKLPADTVGIDFGISVLYPF